MKLVTWNCGGAVRNKIDILQTLNAEIYVVQECEDPKSLAESSPYSQFSQNAFWTGDLSYKGLGIFARPEINLTPNNWPDQGLKHFISLRVNNTFDLVGMWAHKANSPTFGYIGQLWKYLQFHIDRMDHVVLAGDLNSNVQWDKWDRWWNHSDVVRELAEANIHSLYHYMKKLPQGNEQDPTFFLHRNKSKRYHIDYIFASKGIADQARDLSIGDPAFWLQHSDHLPVAVSI